MTKFIVIGQYCWGKGDTEEQALANARKEGGASGVKRHLVYSVHDETYVDGMGCLCYPTEYKPVLIKRVIGKKVEVVNG